MSSESEIKHKNLYFGLAVFGGVVGVFFLAAFLYPPNRAVLFDVIQKNISIFQSEDEKQVIQEGLNVIRPIEDRDHIRGNRNAPVVLIEYADTECPFSKAFQPIMKQIVDEYGVTGSVAWVYRHFPNNQIHSKARTESLALECAGQLGGNDAFWKYTDRIFEVTPSNNDLNFGELTRVAVDLGLDARAFERCIADALYAPRISNDIEEAVSSGALGTPYTIVFSRSGKRGVISGAESYEAVRAAIELALKE
ncbi:MAG: thioredoxin domain-containing protein [Candidatus Uhrbacteria bacterium]|nr:thioredoxin domain-containing protein [Candidatus Uhrbacteria bacterium]